MMDKPSCRPVGSGNAKKWHNHRRSRGTRRRGYARRRGIENLAGFQAVNSASDVVG
jgi:hypothetical protein